MLKGAHSYKHHEDDEIGMSAAAKESRQMDIDMRNAEDKEAGGPGDHPNVAAAEVGMSHDGVGCL